MAICKLCRFCLLTLVIAFGATAGVAQSFQIQCPVKTITHPTAANNNAEPVYNGPTVLSMGTNGYLVPSANVNGAIKCQQISGGDGFATMGDGSQTYLFAFGPLSGLADIAKGLPGTQFPNVFNTVYPGTLLPGDPATTVGAGGLFSYNGAVGLAPDLDAIAKGSCTAPCLNGHVDPRPIMDVGVLNGNMPAPLMALDEDDEFFLTLTNVGQVMRPDLFEQHTVHFHGYPNASAFYDGVPDASVAINIGGSFTYYYLSPDAGTYFWHCHITPPEHLQMGLVGQLYVRPRQNRVPANTDLFNAVAAPAGTAVTYGDGTVGLSQQSDLRTACYSNGQSELYDPTISGTVAAPTAPTADILCSVPAPAAPPVTQAHTRHVAGYKYVYNDGDGSTRYSIDVPIQMHDFDPNFHFVGMTFNPEGFADMKGKYFLLNGRSYPDTVGVATSSVNAAAKWTGGLPDGTSNPDVGTSGAYGTNAIFTSGSDAQQRPEQPISTLVVLSQTGAPDGGPQIAALRMVNLSVEQYHTFASLSMPLHVIGWNAKMLRDQAGNNMDYYTNSITIGGGESMDLLLDSCAARGPAPTYHCNTPVPVGTYFLYEPNLDHLSNDAENFGGLMTEVVVTP